jgi:hypothetical protein
VVTARCFYCEHVREIAPNEQPWPFCADSECEDRFVEIVHALLDGGATLVGMGIDPNSLLGKAAIAETKRARFRMARESYEAKEAECAQSLPAPGDRSAVWRRYFT